MTKDEALRLALEALAYINEGANNQGRPDTINSFSAYIRSMKK